MDKISVLVIFDDEEQLKILKECHDDNGHKGVTSVINTIGARYFWPKWTNQVKEYVLSLRKLFQDADSWDLHLDPALFGIRQAISHTTKYSPLQIAYGRPHEMKLKEMETPKEATEDMLKT
nr:uncharacterized protein LOC117687636 isoform X2 [Crassostrea gigas]